MARNPARPLSPHLTIWKWGPHMLLSILHRVTGIGLATIGATLLVWWLVAAASGPEAYRSFLDCLTTDGGSLNPLAVIVLMGLSWAFFTHMFNGMRHFVLDSGAGYELRTNKRWSVIVMVGALFATVLLWGWLLRGVLAIGGGNG